MLKLRSMGLVIMPEYPGKMGSSGYLQHDWTDQEFEDRVDIMNPNDTGYALLLGSKRNHYMVVDCDGFESIQTLHNILTLDELNTLTVASWNPKKSRALIFKVPELYQKLLLDFNIFVMKGYKNEVFPEYEKLGETKKGGLEFRYNNHKQTIGGKHPSGYSYEFINGVDGEDLVVADLPISLIKLLVEAKVNPTIDATLTNPTSVNNMLSYLPPQWKDDYHKWYMVGCAFHASGLGLEDWLDWSKGSSAYDDEKTPKEAAASWRAMKKPEDLESQNKSYVDMALLSKIAESYGWKPTILDLNNDLNVPFIISEVTKLLLNHKLDDATINLQLQRIKKQYRLDGGNGEYSFNNFVKKLKRKIQLENDFQTDQLLKLEEWISEDLDVNYILTGVLGPALMRTAQQQGTEPEYILGIFLAACASRIGLRATFRSEYTQNAIFWFMFLAESGFNKSGTLSTVLELLQDEQKKFTQEYESANNTWRKDKSKDKSVGPVERIKFISKATITAILDALSNAEKQNDGVLIGADEVSRFFQKGEGATQDNIEIMLELYNGGYLDRRTTTSGSSIISKSALSFAGGSQLETMWEMQKSLEPDSVYFRDAVGFVARWAICCKRPKRRYANFGLSKDPTHVLFSQLLANFFQSLDAIPPREYTLSEEALDLHAIYSNYISDLDATIKRPNVNKYIRKLPGKCLRLAGILHMIQLATLSMGGGPSVVDAEYTIIKADCVNKAIILCNYYYHQMLVLSALTDKNPDVTTQAFQIYNAAISKDEVCARDIQRMLAQFADVPEKDINLLFEFLVKEKLAQVEWRMAKSPRVLGESETESDPQKSPNGVLYLKTLMSIAERKKLREKLKSWILINVRSELTFSIIWRNLCTRFKSYDPKEALGEGKEVCLELLYELVEDGFYKYDRKRFSPVEDRFAQMLDRVEKDVKDLTGQDFQEYCELFTEYRTHLEENDNAVQDYNPKAEHS